MQGKKVSTRWQFYCKGTQHSPVIKVSRAMKYASLDFSATNKSILSIRKYETVCLVKKMQKIFAQFK